jgi:SAM-dependent methyltransferase
MMELSQGRYYDVDSRIPEIYDSIETHTDDINLIREIIGKRKPLRILEPFCGTGRILIPLAQDGHAITGIDKSLPMLDSLRNKIDKLPVSIRGNITLIQADVLAGKWPDGFDIVTLGGNCFYELSTPEEQEKCVALARQALKPGGYLYLDNDHMEGYLHRSWYRPGTEHGCFPTGHCSDGTVITSSRSVVWYDIPRRLVRFRRTVKLKTPQGRTTTKNFLEQKHPPGTDEMTGWLHKYGFEIKNLWGDRRKSPYKDTSPRVVFWTELIEKQA